MYALDNEKGSNNAPQAQDNEALEHLREASREWTGSLVEEANRRGLDPNDLTVAPAALSDQPPLGISGFAQINNWVSYALTSARQQR
ncbi:hypothetical protein DUNSADRAFT_10722 [Dunaliella salina]|uniref:Encoded protein n=1 Tax=Dunaliella salina TaxID=3046 RepID=A0ABQ7FTS8_DUNSA|nr:hypothetical protein DUNSADRAFT_10722 [Dunaliella salina]|eukprot:KAF5825386.1 hypothetical protein DUNSADRAFT_10722 [Dunaliella salina]